MAFDLSTAFFSPNFRPIFYVSLAQVLKVGYEFFMLLHFSFWL